MFEVKSTNGDVHLGGDDFDSVLIDWMADEFNNDEGIDLRKDPMALQRLKKVLKKQNRVIKFFINRDKSTLYNAS